MVILLLQKDVQANLKNRGNFYVYLDKMKQKRRKAPCVESVIYHKGRTKKSAGAPRRVGLA